MCGVTCLNGLLSWGLPATKLNLWRGGQSGTGRMGEAENINHINQDNQKVTARRAEPVDVEARDGGVAKLMAEVEHLLAPQRQCEDLLRHACRPELKAATDSPVRRRRLVSKAAPSTGVSFWTAGGMDRCTCLAYSVLTMYREIARRHNRRKGRGHG